MMMMMTGGIHFALYQHS